MTGGACSALQATYHSLFLDTGERGAEGRFSHAGISCGLWGCPPDASADAFLCGNPLDHWAATLGKEVDSRVGNSLCPSSGHAAFATVPPGLFLQCLSWGLLGAHLPALLASVSCGALGGSVRGLCPLAVCDCSPRVPPRAWVECGYGVSGLLDIRLNSGSCFEAALWEF